MTALSLVYQPLRLGVVLRFILGKLFNISSGIHGLSSVGQNPPSNEELTIVDSRTNRQYHIPIANNAVQAVDIGKIFIGNEFDYSGRVSNALKVLDPGLSNTAVMTSNVTFVDGIKGEIYYRDHSIDELFGHKKRLASASLSTQGSVRQVRFKKQSASSRNEIALVYPKRILLMHGLRRDAPPVSIIVAGLAAYAAAYPNKMPTTANNPLMYRGNMQVVDSAVLDTLAAMAVVISLLYCHQRGQPFTPAKPDNSFIENVLTMMGFILYLDHETTNSTAALLHIASTFADPISCCIGMVASANGPLHGGATELVYKELEQLGSPSNVPALIQDVKAKKIRLFGYGHRIYKTVDPRAKHLQAMLEEFSEESRSNPLLAIGDGDRSRGLH